MFWYSEKGKVPLVNWSFCSLYLFLLIIVIEIIFFHYLIFKNAMLRWRAFVSFCIIQIFNFQYYKSILFCDFWLVKSIFTFALFLIFIVCIVNLLHFLLYIDLCRKPSMPLNSRTSFIWFIWRQLKCSWLNVKILKPSW